MVWLVDLADVCRTSGLPVVEEPGWRTRGHGGMTAVRGIVCHHTAGAATGEYPSMATVRNSPLAQLGLGRSGTVYVIAAGLCWHAGRGMWFGLSGNADTIGIEAESTGDPGWPLDRLWTPAQLEAWPRLCGALAAWYRIPSRFVIAHREWAPDRKPDPEKIDMTALRAAVGQWTPGEDDMPTAKEIADAVWGRDPMQIGEGASRVGPSNGQGILLAAAHQAAAANAAGLRIEARLLVIEARIAGLEVDPPELARRLVPLIGRVGLDGAPLTEAQVREAAERAVRDALGSVGDEPAA